MNCDTGKVFYIISLKFLSICMLNVNVTFLRRLCFFPQEIEMLLYSIYCTYFPEIKKKKKHFHQRGPFRTPTEDIKIYCSTFY